MEKLNLLELLKDCPSGTKLYSTLCGECEIVFIDRVHIIIKDNDNKLTSLFSNGTYRRNGECVLFPSKDQRDWSKFQIPFKDGDIVATNSGNWIGITTGGIYNESIPTYCIIDPNDSLRLYFDKPKSWSFNRLATEVEKQKLFDIIKDNGYKWNEETKTLEKLVEPKFKVGDRVKKKDSNEDVVLITDIADNYYVVETKYGMEVTISIDLQDNWELVPDKFDITTLKPFDKVLVRNTNKDYWRISMFGYISNHDKQYFMCTANSGFYQCIPYEENKHLLGTTDDCDEFYKTWE